MSGLFLEDLTAGRTFESASLSVSAESIKKFAAEFDPQPFHLDEMAAGKTFFNGLAGSGWHTAAITMRLLVDSDFMPAGGLIGIGVDELRWPNPMRPGDELRLISEILESRPSKSRPSHGLAKARVTTLNQNDEEVQILVVNIIVQRRPA